MELQRPPLGGRFLWFGLDAGMVSFRDLICSRLVARNAIRTGHPAAGKVIWEPNPDLSGASGAQSSATWLEHPSDPVWPRYLIFLRWRTGEDARASIISASFSPGSAG